MEDYVRQRHIEEGFEYVGTPHITKEGLFQTSGHLPYYADTMFPPMEMEGANYYLKAMNCPMHNLIFRSRGRSYRELPLRLFEFGSRLPLREVRRRARPDPGARHDPGRLALLRHPRAGARRDQAPARLRASACSRDFGLDDFYLELSTRDDSKPDKFIGSDEEWAIATEVLRGGRRRVRASSWCPTRAARRSTARRSRCRPRDAIGRTWQMSTIQYDFNQPERLRAGVPGRRRHPAAAGDDPLGQVRLDRAVLRRAGRALRRRVPALARAGAGAGDPDRRAPRRLPARRRAAAAGARGSGSRSTTPTTGCRRRSATPSCRRCRSC